MSSSFDQLLTPAEPIDDPFLFVTTRVTEEEDILARFKSDPDLMDLTEQIAETKFLQKRLRDSLDRKSYERIGDLILSIQQSIRKRMIRDIPDAHYAIIDQAVHDSIRHHFPEGDLTVADAEALQKFSMHIGTLAQKYRSVMDGMVVKIEFESQQFDALMRTLFEIVPLSILIAVADKLEQMAPTMGAAMTRELKQ
jgi:uncharacterized FlaG/YvyC family protein